MNSDLKRTSQVLFGDPANGKIWSPIKHRNVAYVEHSQFQRHIKMPNMNREMQILQP